MRGKLTHYAIYCPDVDLYWYQTATFKATMWLKTPTLIFGREDALSLLERERALFDKNPRDAHKTIELVGVLLTQVMTVETRGPSS